MPEWLSGANPLAASTSSTFAARKGMARTEPWYTFEVNSPMNRCSPSTTPLSSTVLMPM